MMRRSALFGLFCTPVGLAAGVHVAATATGEGYGWFPAYAGAASFLAGALSWRVVARTGPSGRRGVVAGACAAVTGHYLTFMLAILVSYGCHLFIGGCRSSLGDPPMNPLFGLIGAIPLTLFSLFFYGAITVPSGALLGYAFARRGESGPERAGPG